MRSPHWSEMVLILAGGPQDVIRTILGGIKAEGQRLTDACDRRRHD